MSYSFWCRRCKFDHAGECSPYTYVVQAIDEAMKKAFSAEVTRYEQESVTITVKLPHPITFIPIVFQIA